jgi:hypothetical protein
LIETWVLIYGTVLCYLISIIANSTWKNQLKHSTKAKVLKVEEIYEEKDGYAVHLRYLLTVEYRNNKHKLVEKTFKYHIRWPIGTIINVDFNDDDVYVLTYPPRSSEFIRAPHVYNIFLVMGNIFAFAVLFRLSEDTKILKWILCIILLLAITCMSRYQTRRIKSKINLLNDLDSQIQVPGKVEYLMRNKLFGKFNVLVKYYALIKYEYNGIVYSFKKRIKQGELNPQEEIIVLLDKQTGERLRLNKKSLNVQRIVLNIILHTTFIAGILLLIFCLPIY